MDSPTSKSFIPLWPWGHNRGVSDFLELEKAIDACYFNFAHNVVSPLEIPCLPISPWLSPECSPWGGSLIYVWTALILGHSCSLLSAMERENHMGCLPFLKPFKVFLWPLESSSCSQQLCMFVPPSTSHPHPSYYPIGRERNSRHGSIFSLPSISLFHSHLQSSDL